MYPNFLSTHMGFALCDANNILAALNGASTFLFYLKFSSQYRRAARSLFRHILQKEGYSLSETEWHRVEMTMNDSPSITTSRYMKIMTNPRKMGMFGMRPKSIELCSFSAVRKTYYFRSKSEDPSSSILKADNECFIDGLRERERLKCITNQFM